MCVLNTGLPITDYIQNIIIYLGQVKTSTFKYLVSRKTPYDKVSEIMVNIFNQLGEGDF